MKLASAGLAQWMLVVQIVAVAVVAESAAVASVGIDELVTCLHEDLKGMKECTAKH